VLRYVLWFLFEIWWEQGGVLKWKIRLGLRKTYHFVETGEEGFFGDYCVGWLVFLGPFFFHVERRRDYVVGLVDFYVWVCDVGGL
jgi:hypothetical protein